MKGRFTRCMVFLLCFVSLFCQAEGIDEIFEKQDYVNRLLPNSPKNFALVVGISQYDHFSDLPTQEDPIKIKNYLLQQANFDYVHVLTEEKVTQNRVKELMEDVFPKTIGAQDRFVFYWSGHGETRENRTAGHKGYLPLKKTRPAKDFSTKISMRDIREWDDMIQAHQVLYLLDSCFSGLAGVSPQSHPKNRKLSEFNQPGRHLISAGNSKEQTIAIDRLGGSIFTAALLEGLNGAADQGEFADGYITTSELTVYVKNRVKALNQQSGWSKSISPQLREMDSGVSLGEFYFTTHKTSNDRLLASLGDLIAIPQSPPIEDNHQKKRLTLGLRFSNIDVDIPDLDTQEDLAHSSLGLTLTHKLYRNIDVEAQLSLGLNESQVLLNESDLDLNFKMDYALGLYLKPGFHLHRFHLYGLAGYAQTKVSSRFNDNNTELSQIDFSLTEHSFSYGAGVSLTLFKNTGLHLEWKKLLENDVYSISNSSFGVHTRF